MSTGKILSTAENIQCSYVFPNGKKKGEKKGEKCEKYVSDRRCDRHYPHICDVCQLEFATVGKLQKHNRVCIGKVTCSAGEYRVMKILDNMYVNYDYNFETVDAEGNLLIFDIAIDTRDSDGMTEDKLLFIEYNGRQHYDIGELVDGERLVNVHQSGDIMKKDFCAVNGHPILWISYENFGRFDELVVDFIISNTTWGAEIEK